MSSERFPTQCSVPRRVQPERGGWADGLKVAVDRQRCVSSLAASAQPCSARCCGSEGDCAPLVFVPLHLPETQFQTCPAVSCMFTARLLGSSVGDVPAWVQRVSSATSLIFYSDWRSSAFLLCLLNYRFVTPIDKEAHELVGNRYLCSYRLGLCFWQNYKFHLIWFLRRLQGKKKAVKSLK